jgi:lipoate synthase
MSKPMIRVHNTETDEIIDREMNSEEFAEYEASIAVLENQKAEDISKAVAKAELLARLGITAEEAQLLLS